MVGAFGAKASGCNGLTQRRSRTAVEAARQSQTEGGGVTRRRFSAVEVVGGGTAAPRTGCNDSDGVNTPESRKEGMTASVHPRGSNFPSAYTHGWKPHPSLKSKGIQNTPW
jgi:hypothetical protein